MKPKLIRITTIPLGLKNLLTGQMRFMQDNGFDVIMVSADGPLKNALVEQEKCQHVVVPMSRKITLWQDLKCLYLLTKLFLKEKPNIVHTHSPKAGLLGMLAAKLTRVPIRIHTVAGMPLTTATGLKKRVLKLTEVITYWGAQYVWPNSYSLQKFIVDEKMIKKSKTFVIEKGSSNGINLEKYNKSALTEELLHLNKEKYKINIKKYNLLFVGRVVRDKGIIELLDAFTIIEQKFPNINLILVGDFEESLDPLPNKYVEMIKANPNIILTNWVEDVTVFYGYANLAVFPSYREGFPNALLQAGALEVPIICSDIMGNIDLISEEFGQIFEVKNSDDLVEKIMFAIENDKEVKARAQKLKQHIYQYYDNKVIMNSILQQYKLLLN
jgi:glycosyltransferase involved in cell wall biosynthesis